MGVVYQCNVRTPQLYKEYNQWVPATFAQNLSVLTRQRHRLQAMYCLVCPLCISVKPWETMAETKNGSRLPSWEPLGSSWQRAWSHCLATSSCRSGSGMQSCAGTRWAPWPSWRLQPRRSKEKARRWTIPEELEVIHFGDKVVIPEDMKKEAFPEGSSWDGGCEDSELPLTP